MAPPSRCICVVCGLIVLLAGHCAAEPLKPIRTLEKSGYVVFSPDGKWLAGTVAGKTWRATDLKLWEVATGKELMVLAGHSGGIWQMAFSPDGKRLASNDNYEVKVWDLERRKEFRSFKAPAFTRSIDFSRDGKRAATGHDDGRVILWDVETGRRAMTLRGHNDWVPGVAFSPEGDRLASASVDMTAKIWDAKTGKVLQTLEGHEWYLNRVAWGPKGKKVITGSDDMTARVWDLETGKSLLTLRGHTDWVVRVAFSPDGKWVATSSGDQTAKIWDARSGEELLTIKAHERRVSCVTFSPDGAIFVTACLDGLVKLWDTQSFSAPK